MSKIPSRRPITRFPQASRSNLGENDHPGKGALVENPSKIASGVGAIRTRKALAPLAADRQTAKPGQLAGKKALGEKVAEMVSKGKVEIKQEVPEVKKDTLSLLPPSPIREVKSFSNYTLPADVEDIDMSDNKNVLLATEYVSDIYKYLRYLERKQAVRQNFLSEQRVLNPKMRSLLVDWLVNVHTQFKLLPETLYMGISIMDRFFQYESVSKDKFQLIGVTSFFIASKYEEIIPPDLSDWVAICDQLYTKRDILKMEMVILRRLKFELGRPLPIHFLRRNSKAAHADPKIHTLAKYLMELSLMDSQCSSWAPSLLAASALYVTLKVLSDGDEFGNWSPTLTHYSAYDEQTILPFACYICKLVLKAPSSRYVNVYKKYCGAKQLEIAKLAQLRGPYVEEMAAKVADS